MQEHEDHDMSKATMSFNRDTMVRQFVVHHSLDFKGIRLD